MFVSPGEVPRHPYLRTQQANLDFLLVEDVLWFWEHIRETALHTVTQGPEIQARPRGCII